MFTVNELLKATSGRLICGRKSTLIKGISTDSRTFSGAEAFVAIKGDNFDGHDFIGQAIKKGAVVIIKDRRLMRLDRGAAVFIEVKDTIKALGDIARFQRKKINIPVIAVTGSNGKTATKEMIAQVLSSKFKVLKNKGTENNQIGLPSTLFKLDKSYDLVVLELCTNHFGEIDYLAKVCLPNIGVITNIGPAHLEYLEDLAGVFKEKTSLLKNLKKPALAIMNADDLKLNKEVMRINKKIVIFGFGISRKSDFCVQDIRFRENKIEFRVRKQKFSLDTFSFCNIYNALAAISIGRIFGIGYKEMAKSLANFNFPQGRFCLRRIRGTSFIDDTYNSNPTSLKEALNALANIPVKGRRIFIMGDMYELGRKAEFFHRQAGKDIARICDIFIGVGKLSMVTAEAVRIYGLSAKYILTCESSFQARDILFNRIIPTKNDIILVKGSRRMKMEEVLKV
jgi:UDP-N-acetylmuramoyl-tripeptide--D-alanyl-D-alanine ligase